MIVVQFFLFISGSTTHIKAARPI